MSVRHALLALLTDGPMYGLRLQQEFEAGTGEIWPLNVGQVYSTLQRLERDGLVESTGDDGPQRDFQITDSGRGELDAWLTTPPDSGAPPRDALVMKVLIAARLPGVDVAALLQRHRRQLVEQMQRYTRLKESVGDDDVSILLVADAELFRLDAMIRWLDVADARLRRTSGPAPLARSSDHPVTETLT